MPNREAVFAQTFQIALEEARSYRVVEPLAVRHAYATALMYWFYDASEPQRPDIISGYRSPARQSELLQRWNAGDRNGIAARPACRSWHTVGRAIDVEANRPEWMHIYGQFMQWLGCRWGRDFGDPNHFDLPGGVQPVNICSA